MPDDWIISRICEEFSCTPSEAIRQPLGLTLRIIELRAYARAKQALAEAQSETDVPQTPAVEWVWEVEQELLRRRRMRRDGIE